ncbi:MAG TPA: murein biosynthesis integral membrane protein MurJ [Gaiellaceae bacterium]|nr:murein biosynthesis integral membrane protein MurJ [Gaiellaceae bacterium]
MDEHSGRRLARSTAIFSLATGLSRIAGLIREVVAAYYFGAAGKINAFTVAFQVPNLIRALVADAALSSAFVPVFTELQERGERQRAWRVAASLFWIVLLGLSALTAIFIVIAPWVIGLFGDPGGDKQLAIGLSRVLFPIVALLGVSGIVVGILNSYERFTVPALSPIFWNLAIIVGLVLGVPNAHTIDAKLYVYAISIVIGTVIQVLLPMPWLRGLDGKLRVLIDWRDPAVWRVLKLMLPVTLGLGLINFNAVVDSIFASRLIDPTLAPTAIDKAFRLYMLPQGIFSVAITTVLFPSLARLSARGDQAGFRNTLASGLRQIAFLLIPAGVISAVLAEPITRLVYQRGHFEPAQTPVVAAALAAFSAGLFFNGMMLLLNRGFFSLQSNWIPTCVALANLCLNAALDAIFYRFGTWGIPLATSLVNVAGSAVLLVLMRRRLGRLGFGQIMDSVLRIVTASAVLAGAAYGTWYELDSALGRGFLGQLVSVVTALVVGTAVYLFTCRALKVRELGPLLALRNRLKRG